MDSQQANPQQRRAFWAQRMDEAWGFMKRKIDHPIEECGEPMVALGPAAQDAGVEVSFSRCPHANGGQRMFYLRHGLVDGFLRVAEEMTRRKWVLHVEDGFRSLAMQRALARQPRTFDVVLERVRWEMGEGALDPDLLFRRLSVLIALRPKLGGHMSGSAIDVSVFERGSEIDRGGSYLDLSERTPMDSPFICEEARHNRRQITAVFEQFGFTAYPYEFWHYSQGDVTGQILSGDGRPARYGPVEFDETDGCVRPIEDPLAPLNSIEDIRRMVADRCRDPQAAEEDS